MTVNVTKPQINLREKISEVDKPSGIVGEAILRSETPQEVFNYINAGRRNLIINGAMQVAQRGTSHSTAGYGSLDRWFLALSGATATLSQESFTLGQTDVVGAEYYAKVDVTTGNNNCGLFYKVEAKDVISAGGQEVTLSYWAKGTSPTNGLKVGLSLVATGGSAVTDESVTLTSTWTKYTHTFTLPSFSGVTLDASSYLELHFDQDNGDTGTAAWELNIAQVQLEVGKVATPFEHRSYGEELALCQRYYQNSFDAGEAPTHNSSNAVYRAVQPFSGGNLAGVSVPFPVVMRATPTFTLWTAAPSANTNSGNISFYNGSTWSNASTVTHESSSSKRISITSSAAPSGTVLIQFNFEADAEL